MTKWMNENETWDENIMYLCDSRLWRVKICQYLTAGKIEKENTACCLWNNWHLLSNRTARCLATLPTRDQYRFVIIPINVFWKINLEGQFISRYIVRALLNIATDTHTEGPCSTRPVSVALSGGHFWSTIHKSRNTAKLVFNCLNNLHNQTIYKSILSLSCSSLVEKNENNETISTLNNCGIKRPHVSLTSFDLCQGLIFLCS